MISKEDTDGNGRIDVAEFVTLMARKTDNARKDADVREAFSACDRAGLPQVTHSLGQGVTDGEARFRPVARSAVRSRSSGRRRAPYSAAAMASSPRHPCGRPTWTRRMRPGIEFLYFYISDLCVGEIH